MPQRELFRNLLEARTTIEKWRGTKVEEALQRGEPAQPATVKPLAQPLGVVPELDPKSLALLEAAPAVRADIAQSVEQRFRKP